MDMITDQNTMDTGLRWQSSAILALQEATEAYLVHLFEDAFVHVVLPKCLQAANAISLGTFVQYMRSGLPS